MAKRSRIIQRSQYFHKESKTWHTLVARIIPDAGNRNRFRHEVEYTLDGRTARVINEHLNEAMAEAEKAINEALKVSWVKMLAVQFEWNAPNDSTAVRLDYTGYELGTVAGEDAPTLIREQAVYDHPGVDRAQPFRRRQFVTSYRVPPELSKGNLKLDSNHEYALIPDTPENRKVLDELHGAFSALGDRLAKFLTATKIEDTLRQAALKGGGTKLLGG